MNNNNNLITLDKISKNFHFKGDKIEVLKNINLDMKKGDFITVKGKSGSGKTTLLNIVSGLLKPTSGKILLNNKSVNRFFDFYSSRFRSKNIGFIFQNFNLISYQTVLENVMSPLIFSSELPLKHEALALKALKSVGLYEKRNFYPNLLSGGQMQRVAIARAIVKDPILIIADEPTGNLDFKTADEINEIFINLNKEKNISLIVVTHSKEIASSSKRQFELINGELLNINGN